MKQRDILAFRDDLLHWYRDNQRILPWREDPSPYRVYVSEIMLQQTKVAAVLPYFDRFMFTFPTIESLANASEDQLLHTWQGLGYYQRALNLHKTAKKIVQEAKGVFPTEYKAWLDLPGIGDYTASAILSIAFQQPYPVVDGNILRIFARVTNCTDNVLDKNTYKACHSWMSQLLPTIVPGDFNQAMMELGAIVCIPQKPECAICPIQSYCKAFKLGTTSRLPVRISKTKSKPQYVILFVINSKDKIAISKSSEKLLGSLWKFPTLVFDQKEDFEAQFHSLEDSIDSTLSSYTYQFTHLRWEVIAIRMKKCWNYSELTESLTWIKEQALNSYPMPTVYDKIRQLLNR